MSVTLGGRRSVRSVCCIDVRRPRREGTLARAWKCGPKVLFPVVCRLFFFQIFFLGGGLPINKNRGMFLKVEVMIHLWYYKGWLLEMLIYNWSC